MVPDDKIIQGCIKGKRLAQNQLYSKYADLMLGVCLRYSRSYHDAEDILQDGFLKVFLKVRDFQKKGSFEGWIRRIMVNTALNYYRQKDPHMFTENIQEIAIQNEHDDELENINFRIPAHKLMEMVQELPDGYRMVFNLYVFESKKHKEISQLLNISENTSKTQLFKARKLLKKNIQQQVAINDNKELYHERA